MRRQIVIMLLGLMTTLSLHVLPMSKAERVITLPNPTNTSAKSLTAPMASTGTTTVPATTPP